MRSVAIHARPERVSTALTTTNSEDLNKVTKEELRAELERQAQRFQNIYGGEITTYAAQSTPDRKPWRKRPSVMDKVYEAEVQKIAEQKAHSEQDVHEQEA